MWVNFSHLKDLKKTKWSLSEAMQIYIDENSNADDFDGTDYIAIFEHQGQLKCLEAIYKIFFERKSHKKNLVWLYGPPNTGKTTLIKALEQIFCTQDFNFQEKYCVLQEPSKKDCEVQLLVSKEFEVDHAFSANNYTQMKRMFEGLGASVRNNLFHEFRA